MKRGRLGDSIFVGQRLPALALDAPDGWTLEGAKVGRKLAISGDQARPAIRHGDPDGGGRRRGAAPAARPDAARAGVRGRRHVQRPDRRICRRPGFLATGPCGRSAPGWSSAMRTSCRRHLHADGKPTAREACRPLLAKLRWRAPGLKKRLRSEARRLRRRVGHERIRVADGHHARRGGLREHPRVGLVRDAALDALVVHGVASSTCAWITRPSRLNISVTTTRPGDVAPPSASGSRPSPRPAARPARCGAAPCSRSRAARRRSGRAGRRRDRRARR